MSKAPRLLAALLSFWNPLIWCQQLPTQLKVPRDQAVHEYQLPSGVLNSSRPKAWSITMDLEPFGEISEQQFLVVTDSNKSKRLEAQIVDDSGTKGIEVLVTSDFNPKPLSLNLPLRLIDISKPHIVLVRYVGSGLDLFCDGVLVDEDWPIGTIVSTDVVHAAVRFPISQLSVGSTEVTDDQISIANGGPVEVDKRTDAMFGKDWQSAQYARPRGFNTNAGDAMPFFHDGTLHLFFLLDRRQHRSKWGLGAHQWGHISSTDLVHWKRYPPALTIDHEWEGSICTGSVFFDNGRYYAFYATRMPDRSERLGMAESQDGIHFAKILPTPFSEPIPPFLHGPNRDPFVFQIGKEFHMLVTASVPADNDPKNRGALEHLVSTDLKTWTVLPTPFLVPGGAPQPECSDFFKWHEWYYLLFSISGTTHYRISRSDTGPWIAPKVDVLDGPEAIVMKSAAFKGDRRILVGFLQHDNRYGGDLIFRELVQQSDGSLGTKIPGEMELRGITKSKTRSLHLSREHPFSAIGDHGAHVRLTATLISSHSSSPFGIGIGTDETGHGGERLVIDPASKRILWANSTGEDTRAKIEDVEGLDRPTVIDVVLDGTIADVSVDRHRTLIHRLSTTTEHQITFFTQGTDMKVSKIEVSAIPYSPRPR